MVGVGGSSPLERTIVFSCCPFPVTPCKPIYLLCFKAFLPVVFCKLPWSSLCSSTVLRLPSPPVPPLLLCFNFFFVTRFLLTFSFFSVLRYSSNIGFLPSSDASLAFSFFSGLRGSSHVRFPLSFDFFFCSISLLPSHALPYFDFSSYSDARLDFDAASLLPFSPVRRSVCRTAVASLPPLALAVRRRFLLPTAGFFCATI